MRHLLPLFLLSGFSGLVYQVVWLRLAMAAFGVTAPLVSTVLSVFMAGLAIGSWMAGRLAVHVGRRESVRPLRLYALAEAVVASSALVVPWMLDRGRSFLATAAADVTWGSVAHHLAAGAWVSLVLAPFCIAMGMTLPLGIWAVKRAAPEETAGSFGQLYLANTIGACLGTLAAAFVIVELLGFGGALAVAATCNLAAGAVALGFSVDRGAPPAPARDERPTSPGTGSIAPGRAIPTFLFLSGFASMGMEVAWVRVFTPWLGTVVYAFALIVAIYLGATFVGSWLYTRRQRPWSRESTEPAARWLGIGAGLSALLPLALADPRLPWTESFLAGAVRVGLAVVPLCAVLGYLTPALVERWSGGDPRRTGAVYALNAAGCVLGPLLAGFVLLPAVGERWTITLLALSLLVSAPALAERKGERGWRRSLPAMGAAATAVAVLALTVDPYAERPGVEVRRDATATVVAHGAGMWRQLQVNGVGMTQLTPITKLMAHLPLALQQRPPESGLVVCFGMGTSFRSMHAWGIRATAVELVPSVPELFGFFHADAAEIMRSPRARIVIDDGRRYLERNAELFDVITIDPPPPVSAAGSSLLYSREFYEVAHRRLRRGGILQQWTPGGDGVDFAAFVGALQAVFPHVVALQSIEGWGLHLLASDEPIDLATPEVLAARLPAAAVADLVEWGPERSAVGQFRLALLHRVEIPEILALAPGTAPLSDDHPVNEYFALRALANLDEE